MQGEQERGGRGARKEGAKEEEVPGAHPKGKKGPKESGKCTQRQCGEHLFGSRRERRAHWPMPERGVDTAVVEKWGGGSNANREEEKIEQPKVQVSNVLKLTCQGRRSGIVKDHS